MIRAVLAVCVALTLAACAGTGISREAPAPTPVMRWDHRPEASLWTEASLDALQSHGAVLPTFVPGDIETWCPDYSENGPAERQMFWSGLLSALAKHESTWNPGAVGGGGRWYGLVQIAPATARLYGCRATTGSGLKDGADNLSCAVRIMAGRVARGTATSDRVRGVTTDWGPMHSADKRAEMRSWISQQPYCSSAAAVTSG